MSETNQWKLSKWQVIWQRQMKNDLFFNATLFALCSLPFALCPLPFALCPVALCPLLFALCPLLFALLLFPLCSLPSSMARKVPGRASPVKLSLPLIRTRLLREELIGPSFP
jgi:hypothetical protein